MANETKPPLNPGSKEARAAGCQCPVLDNRHGVGAYTDEHGVAQFWISEDCRLHGQAAKFHVFWSDEDKCFFATSPKPEHKYLSAFGNTEQKACDELCVVLHAVREILEVESAKE